MLPGALGLEPKSSASEGTCSIRSTSILTEQVTLCTCMWSWGLPHAGQTTLGSLVDREQRLDSPGLFFRHLGSSLVTWMARCISYSQCNFFGTRTTTGQVGYSQGASRRHRRGHGGRAGSSTVESQGCAHSCTQTPALSLLLSTHRESHHRSPLHSLKNF